MSLTVNGAATNAGDHSATASCSSVSGGRAKCSNYTLTGATKSFTINKITNTLYVSARNLTYSESSQ